MNAHTEAAQREDFLDLEEIFARVLNQRWWILGISALFGILSAVYAFTATPVYRVKTVLVPANTDNGLNGVLDSAVGAFGGLAALAGVGLGGAEAKTEEALAVLQSRQFTEAFITDEQLMPKLFPKMWNATRGEWATSPEQRPTPAKAYKVFDRSVRSVSRDRKTGLVTMQIDWRDRNEAAIWANKLVQRLNSEMRLRAIANAEASVGFLKNELASTLDVGTREAINRLIEAQIKQRMLANVTHEYVFRVVDKAMPPDQDDPIRPKKLQTIAAGVLLGAILGAASVLIIGRRKK